MASKILVHQGELTKRSIKSKTNWKPRYFMLWYVEGGPPILEYYRKKGATKPKGELVLGPGTTAEVKRDICKKSFFGMHVQVFEVAAKGAAGNKNKRKSAKGQLAHLYCYADTYGTISKWVQEIQDCVARAWYPPGGGPSAGGSAAGTTPTAVNDGYVDGVGPQEQLFTHRTKSGWLYKKTKKKWKPKFFVLEGTTLMYFESEGDYQKNQYRPNRRIPLCIGSKRCKVGSMPIDQAKPGNTFGFSLIELPKKKKSKKKHHKKYNLCSDSQTDCLSWIEAVSTALDLALNQRVAPASPKDDFFDALGDMAEIGEDHYGVVSTANQREEGVYIDKPAPNDPSRAAELKAEMARRKKRLGGASPTDDNTIWRQAVKSLMWRDFQEVQRASEAVIKSYKNDVKVLLSRLQVEKEDGGITQVERLSKRINQKRAAIDREEQRLAVILERCAEAKKEVREAQEDGLLPPSPHPRRHHREASNIGVPPVYKFSVAFVDDTKLGLKLSKRIKAGGVAVIMVIGFNVDDSGGKYQPSATSQVQKGDVLFSVDGKTSIEDQLKGIKSPKRPLQVTFQRNVQILDTSDDANRRVLDSYVFENKDNRILDAIPKWEEYAKATPEYWHNRHEAKAPESAWQLHDVSSLSVAQVGQLLASWDLFKAFGKEFLQYEIMGEDLLKFEEIHFERNKRLDYPNATDADAKRLFKKLREVNAHSKVKLYQGHATWTPRADANKLSVLYQYLETGSSDPNGPTPLNYSI